MSTGRQTCVCAACGQGFTRKSSANRHNNSLHFGHAMIVKPYDYIIGRIKGEFLPGNPSIYRRNQRNQTKSSNNFHLPQANNRDKPNFTINAAVRQGVSRPPNFNSMGSQEKTLNRSSAIRPDNNNQPSLASSRDEEHDLKLEELRTLFHRNYSPWVAHKIWSRTVYLAQIDSIHLDFMLDSQRMIAQRKHLSHFKFHQSFDSF
jgi:hypothetical protein